MKLTFRPSDSSVFSWVSFVFSVLICYFSSKKCTLKPYSFLSTINGRSLSKPWLTVMWLQET
jgi:hypothetical protein